MSGRDSLTQAGLLRRRLGFKNGHRHDYRQTGAFSTAFLEAVRHSPGPGFGVEWLGPGIRLTPWTNPRGWWEPDRAEEQAFHVEQVESLVERRLAQGITGKAAESCQVPPPPRL